MFKFRNFERGLIITFHFISGLQGGYVNKRGGNAYGYLDMSTRLVEMSGGHD